MVVVVQVVTMAVVLVLVFQPTEDGKEGVSERVSNGGGNERTLQSVTPQYISLLTQSLHYPPPTTTRLSHSLTHSCTHYDGGIPLPICLHFRPFISFYVSLIYS